MDTDTDINEMDNQALILHESKLSIKVSYDCRLFHYIFLNPPTPKNYILNDFPFVPSSALDRRHLPALVYTISLVLGNSGYE